MKDRILVGVVLGCSLLFGSFPVHALSPETEVLLDLLQAKGVITKKDAESFRLTIEERMDVQAAKGDTDEKVHYHSVQGLAKRVEKLEGKAEDKFLGAWVDKVELSGIIEVEASYERLESGTAGVATEKSSDIVLATAELDVDVDIAQYVDGHVAFLFEEDEEDDHVIIDEGIISIDGAERCRFYANIGKMYVPFGRFESHFISDPLTLELGETNESAILVGYRNDLLDISVGAFNGDIDKAGNSNHVETFVAAAVLSLPDETIPEVGVTFGASYISNIADSDGLQDVGVGVSADTVQDYVSGFSAFVSASIKEKVFFDAEYLGATDSFQAGELSFDGGNANEPTAWNLELAYGVFSDLELAIRYEGSDDGGDFLAEEQYGAALLYNLFENTALTFEYLHGEFENNDERNSATLQLAAEF